MIEISTRAISARIRISATEIQETRDLGTFGALARYDWAHLIEEHQMRDAHEWANFLSNDGRRIQHVPPWLQVPEGL